jgi:hypothetical protein
VEHSKGFFKKMNQKELTLIIVLVLAIIAVGGYFVFFQKQETSHTIINTPSAASQNIQLPNTSTSRTPVKESNLLTGYTIEKIWDIASPGYLRAFAIDSQDNMYVSQVYEGEGTNARIVKYDKGGKLLDWFGKGAETTGWHGPDLSEQSFAGTGDGEFYYIFKIVFDQNDNMYVVDRDYYEKNQILKPGNERIQKFDKSGNFLGWLGKGNNTIGWHNPKSGEMSIASDEAGALKEPTCIMLHGADLLISSWSLHKLDKFDLMTGVLKEWLGKSESGSYGWHTPNEKSVAASFYGQEMGAFNNPFDCKIDSKERLYVLSYNSDPVIAMFDYKSGEYLDGLFHSQGYKPANMILDKYDNLIISDNYEGSVRFLNRNKKEVAKLQLGPGGDYFAIGDFAFDTQGYIFFLEKMKNKIYKIKLDYE